MPSKSKNIITPNPKQIDWEQRRYEIALAMYAHYPSFSAETAVFHADELTKALKKD